jgi:hypothetical protein
MIQDFRFALRQLIKAPGFTAVAVFTLALAIGVNSAIFALVNGLIFKPVVPLKPEEVVNVFNARQGASKEYRQFSWNEYQAVKQGSEVFADVAAVQFALAGLGRDEAMRRSFAFFVSENYFSMLGAKPTIGRFFTAEESRPNANAPVVIVTHSYWKKMGGRADFVGSTIYVNGRPYTVIGVTPDGFSGLKRAARAGCLAALRHVLHPELRLQRQHADRSGAAEELHGQPRRPPAAGPDHRGREGSPAGGRATA